MKPSAKSPPRELDAHMLSLQVVAVRSTPEEELRIKLDILPLRLYMDQDTLKFLLGFLPHGSRPTKPSVGPYIQYFEASPLTVKVDYKPKQIDFSSLKHGGFAELLNVFQLDGAKMTLSPIKLTGIQGFERLVKEMQAIWLPHITQTQLGGMVSGVAPIRSIVNLGTGVADLVLLPIEQYYKDGQWTRGLTKGIDAFAHKTAMEAIRLGTKLAVGTQVLLEHADDILNFDTDTATVLSTNDESTSKFGNQPATVQEGMQLAYKSLTKHIGTAVNTIIAIPMDVVDTSTHGTVKAVIRAVPIAVIRPAIGATEAVSKTLLGLRNQLDPTNKSQMHDKYK
jgi:autophagy-related protein 2